MAARVRIVSWPGLEVPTDQADKIWSWKYDSLCQHWMLRVQHYRKFHVNHVAQAAPWRWWGSGPGRPVASCLGWPAWWCCKCAAVSTCNKIGDKIYSLVLMGSVLPYPHTWQPCHTHGNPVAMPLISPDTISPPCTETPSTNISQCCCRLFFL